MSDSPTVPTPLDERVEQTWQRARRAQRAQGLTTAVVLPCWVLVKAFLLDWEETTSGRPTALAVAVVMGILVSGGTLATYRWARRGSWFAAPLLRGLEEADARAVRRAVATGTPPHDPLLAVVALAHCRRLLRQGVVVAGLVGLLAAGGVWAGVSADGDGVARAVGLGAGAALVVMVGWQLRLVGRARRYLATHGGR